MGGASPFFTREGITFFPLRPSPRAPAQGQGRSGAPGRQPVLLSHRSSHLDHFEIPPLRELPRPRPEPPRPRHRARAPSSLAQDLRTKSSPDQGRGPDKPIQTGGRQWGALPVCWGNKGSNGCSLKILSRKNFLVRYFLVEIFSIY